MSIYIGENIKNLRRKKDITQEQLSEFLNISNVAVSKWERGETFPDISFLPILAKYFNVTIDELMGYDASKIQEQIDEIEKEYWQFRANGKFDNASSLIAKARKKYYDDYRIMYLYMHNMIGGHVANSSMLIDCKDELLHICDNILRGCNIERIRLEAINIKAKILYAQGEKQQALDILKVFPDFGGTVGIKSEQLFEYDSDDSRDWVRKNLYSLAEVYSVKLIKKIWFDNALTIYEKILSAEQLGDAYIDIYNKTEEISALLMAHKLLESLSLRLIADFGNEDDVIRIKYKELQCAKMLDEVASGDCILRDMINKLYSGKRVLVWSLDFLETAPQKTYERMRNSLEFNRMLKKFR